ncbi:MAG TPA: IMP cyclohydrolase [Oscillospiraceae bacterium]|nr:IMP cyclohydrolase [Oscillospiraceae bacterium]HPF55193.1 IMP cyclohydrolase [Clostridiales bacterium]HPK36423.1 IMP cyclohydrolase [Oscillospiraceae bacterium]HPR75727.1 IMP cyclohydrolase [Oscillospiraceae bacterium]
MKTIEQALSKNTYPGRGILLGMNKDGEKVMAYFIMGRSENSRNRVFVETEGGGLKTEAFDPSKVTDPSLIIYHPVRRFNGMTIVTNGDQTDTIFAALRLGGSFESALRTRRFEPDEPNFTPRISGIYADAEYKLSILKSAPQNPTAVYRQFFEYTPIPGVGHLIHTYDCDGNPLPSFTGESTEIAVEGDIDAFTETLWNTLNEANKISLFVRFENPLSGDTETRVVNKNGGK